MGIVFWELCEWALKIFGGLFCVKKKSVNRMEIENLSSIVGFLGFSVEQLNGYDDFLLNIFC
jgi:hypothetical protein